MTEKFLKPIGGFFEQEILLGDSFDQMFPQELSGRKRHCYETGTDALAAILEESKASTLWVPEHFCEESLVRLKLVSNVAIRRYSQECAYEEFDAILFVHLNRWDASLALKAEKLRSQKNFIPIHDCVQAPFDMARVHDGYCYNSLRKVSSLELAVAYLLAEATDSSQKNSAYRSQKNAAKDRKKNYVASKDSNPEREKDYVELNRIAENFLQKNGIQPAHVEEVALARSIDWALIRQKRIQNYQVLKNALEKLPALKILPGEYMYLLAALDDPQGLKSHLYSARIFPVNHWPDSLDPNAKRTLSLHVDQRYNAEDMNRQSREIINYMDIQKSKSGSFGSEN